MFRAHIHSFVLLLVITAIFAGSLSWAQTPKAPPPKKKPHAWEVFMQQPQAIEEAKQLRGHCGDADNQAAMNACFAAQAAESDQRLNTLYRKLLNELEPEDVPRMKAAQRAWLKYRDAQCEYDRGLVGTGSLLPTVDGMCRSTLTDQRIAYLEGRSSPK